MVFIRSGRANGTASASSRQGFYFARKVLRHRPAYMIANITTHNVNAVAEGNPAARPYGLEPGKWHFGRKQRRGMFISARDLQVGRSGFFGTHSNGKRRAPFHSKTTDPRTQWISTRKSFEG